MGRGSFVGNGEDLIMLDSASSCKSPSFSSPCSSLALGTKSDRNSRSSDVSASECRWLGVGLLFVREKRPRKRETAEGGG